MDTETPPFLRRMLLRNYKSIGACDVELGPCTFFVGPNGSGKSNFFDSLRFVADSLNTSLDHAIRDRGGIGEVRRRSTGHPRHFGMGLEFRLPEGGQGTYQFVVSAKPQGGYQVQREHCEVFDTLHSSRAMFTVRKGQLERAPGPVSPPASADRLYLVGAAGLPEFRPVFDGISRMAFYNLVPERIRDLQPPHAGDVLARDGSNLPSVLGQMVHGDPERWRLIEEYLAKVVPGIEGVEHCALGPKETIQFRQRIEGATSAWKFYAASMSDGTLRALGVLVALFHASRAGVRVAGIEEPEIALHPAAAGILRDCIRTASRSTQVLVTSHSPDLLDDPKLDPASLLAVVAEEGTTKIAHLDEAGRSALREGLYSAGELLRMNQLLPDRDEILRAEASQLGLFGEGDP